MNEYVGGNFYAVGADPDAVHFYFLASGDPVELYARPYDPASDASVPQPFTDPVAREAEVKKLQVAQPDSKIDKQFNQDIENLSPTELALLAALVDKDGMALRSAIDSIPPADLDNQLNATLGVFNQPAITALVDVVDSKDSSELDIDYVTAQSSTATLYTGPWQLVGSQSGSATLTGSQQ